MGDSAITRFFLPDFYGKYRMILFMKTLMERYPDRFFDDIAISAAYGTFPGAIWNGGRVILGSSTKEQMEFVIRALNENGIAVRFTFTNPLIEEKHLWDTYCNLILDLADNGMNEVLVNSPCLEEYIRRTHPDYKILSSTTKCLNTVEDIRAELEKDYHLVVLDSAFNNTDELFEMPHKEKIELLANHYCMDNCPNRQEHYRVVGECQLNFCEIKFKKCTKINRDFYQMLENRSFITTDLIYGKYKEAGFYNFKIDGRAFNKYKVLESYMYFFVRPEYRDEVRLACLKQIDRL
ncbi:MAG: hypothetical protein K5840_05410 [Eubacterium sp.]|nr:hypothetical protein [Eubacterium sp.]